MAAAPDVNALVAALGSDGPKDRLQAAYQLGQLGNRSAVGPLLKALNDCNDHVATTAADALGELRAVSAVPKLIWALKEGSESMRGAAAMALGKIAAPEAAESLIAALGDAGTFVRRNAADALGGLDDGRAVEPLRGLFNDNQEYVRDAAREALAKLTAARTPSEVGGESGILHFTCHNCGKKLRAKAVLAGKKARCPECQQAVAIPRVEKGRLPEGAAASPQAAKKERLLTAVAMVWRLRASRCGEQLVAQSEPAFWGFLDEMQLEMELRQGILTLTEQEIAQVQAILNKGE
jgi:HEAT repeat protein/DNA-directed RNA polymerase subunit RPC12/RpoP